MSKDRDRSHRSALWLSTMLTLVGSCGACNGASLYAAGPPPSVDLVDTADGPGARELAEVASALGVTYLDAETRRPLAAANLVVSLMLVVGSFMLGSRSKNARWFILNALVANLVFIVADVAASVVRIESRRTLLAQKLMRWALSMEGTSPPMTEPQARAWAESFVTTLGGTLVVIGLAKLLFHVLLLVRTRSEEITAFLEEKAED